MSGKAGGRAGEDVATFGAVERLEAVDRMQQLKRLHQPRESDKPDGRHARFLEEKEPLSCSAPESPDVEDMHLALIQAYNNQLVVWKVRYDLRPVVRFAWWDSSDGKHGGYKIRVEVSESERKTINEYDLFPAERSSITLVTATHQSIELPYTTCSFCSADSFGPAGFIFVAPKGISFPINAVLVLPSVEKQLQRARQESEKRFVERELERQYKIQDDMNKLRIRQRRFERRQDIEYRFHNILERSRKEATTQPIAQALYESQDFPYMHAVWKQLKPAGVYPPPDKHPIVVKYYAEMTSVQGVEVNVLTFEVWSRSFDVRYTIHLQVQDAITGRVINTSVPGILLYTWSRIHVFNAESAPSARDAPSLCYAKRRLWLFGGKTRGGQYKTFYDDLWTYDYDTNEWTLYTKAEQITNAKGEIKRKKGVHGKRPPGSSSAILLHRRTESGEFLYLAGGNTHSSKRRDVRKLDISRNSSTYLKWSELIAHGESQVAAMVSTLQEGDEEVKGDPPLKGFSLKTLHTSHQVYCSCIEDGEVYELCLSSKKWSKIPVENVLPWKTSKVLLADLKIKVRFILVDFFTKSPSEGYPAVETGEIWRIYSKVNANDDREDARKEWMLCPNQTVQFVSAPCFGDVPGMQEGEEGGELGGELEEPEPADLSQDWVVGRDAYPQVGLLVQRRKDKGVGGGAGLVIDVFTVEDAGGKEEKVCRVRWNETGDEENFSPSQQGDYDLKMCIDSDLYATRNASNELWSLDIIEPTDHKDTMSELESIRLAQGFTDANVLKTVLGRTFRTSSSS
ncbi:hypothetical protein GUITHDRAFT_161748 [Guillardia theta CCMP2712]|uniref:Uncharacterized protein n=1 Tax=Guillardia theta (strain CCMP2712) TaxID=905079 RepID=L1JR56_GUITC|nr:hypothetical protein GUITHDRAFT_161748 [Guillardia theta CCMP2712]EKX50922.1 hypothetical protein GUITHDRAFT_161748 [Guillardia theta CCMP2712]|eukprot:XP_005837902.1 hypothetical protein GUITHDRAFT_161748 [Guillardia theta CCMP2712]